MPTCLSVIPAFSPKNLKLTLLLLLSPLFFHGQSLTGLWTGSLSNDSTTIRKDQSFEIALTEYKGKVFGYSRSEFIVNDTLFYILKRVKGIIEGDVCEVTDDEIVSYNFRGKLDKGIKVTSTFRRNKNDSTWHLDGNWKTNATKKYYSVTGKVGLEEEKDLAASKIFPHLEELKLADDVAFYKERKEGPSIVKIAKPEKIKTEYTTGIDQSGTPAIAVAAPVIIAKQPETSIEDIAAVKKPADDLPAAPVNTIPSSTSDVASISIANNKTISKPTVPTSIDEVAPAEAKTKPAENALENKTSSTVASKPVDTKTIAPSTVAKNNTPETKPVVTGQRTVAASPAVNNKPNDVVVNKSGNPVSNPANNKQPVIVSNATISTTPVKDNNPVITKAAPKAPAATGSINDSKPSEPVVKKSVEEVIAKAAVIGGRKSDFSQVVNFKSDSLELSLYDNGEIDGDTVSVYMNGEVILDKQGLKSNAIKKTIYIKPGQDEDFTLVMFAESLGKYPPNTGLLVIHDGNDVYNLRFSSDFQKSSGIVFRKRR